MRVFVLHSRLKYVTGIVSMLALYLLGPSLRAQDTRAGAHGTSPLKVGGRDSSEFMMTPFPSQTKVFRETYTHGELSGGTSSIPIKKLYVKEDPSTLYCTDRSILKAVVNARLKMGANDYEFGRTPFDVAVVLDIIPCDANDVPLSVPSYSCSLNVKVQSPIIKPEQLFRKDFTSIYGTVDHFNVKIASYTATFDATNQTALQNNLQLEIFYTEEFKTPGVNATSAMPAITITDLALSHTAVTANPVTFQWNPTTECLHDPFPNYEFQILRLFNRSEDQSATDETSIIDTIHWERALTMETGNGNTLLKLTIPEGTGYYVWRVRPIGNTYPGGIANDRNWGLWTIAPPQGARVTISGLNESSLEVSAWGPSIFFYNELDRDKNWIYSRTFSEGSEGTRIGEKMTYATNLLQPRQAQRHMQSKDSMLVGQTVLDYNGRPVLNSLSAPVPWNGFSYQSSFLKSSSGLYTAANFDSDPYFLGGNIISPDPATSDPVSSYYSDANPDLSVANANGYPFSRILYYSDASGRVKEQGGEGEVHRLGGNADGKTRTVRSYYDRASDDLLISMFGDEAPASSTVQRITTIDPNGVPTVSFISKEGKTLATCLVKLQNSTGVNLQELNNEPANFNRTVVEHMAGNSPAGTNGFSSGVTVSLVESGSLTIDYNITPKEIASECTSYCASCDYAVEFYVVAMTTPITSVFYEKVPISADSCGKDHAFTKHITTGSLSAGTYVVSRRITTNTINPSGTPYMELHSDSVARLIWVQDSLKLVKVNHFLDVVDLGGLYHYLDSLHNVNLAPLSYDDTFGANVYTLSTSCCSIKIPIMHCGPESPCAGATPSNFEQLLFDTWGSSHYAYQGITGKNFGDNLDKYFYSYTDSRHPLYPPAINFPGGKGQFNKMIAHMLADYNCELLWTAWTQVVQGFALRSTRLHNGDPDDPDPNYSLLEDFLGRVGKEYVGVSNCPYGTCNQAGGYGEGYLEYAYKYFEYGTDDGTDDCRKILLGLDNQGNPRKLLNNGQPVQPTGWSQDGKSADPATKKWEILYNCLYSVAHPPKIDLKLPFECDPPNSEACVIAMRDEEQNACRTNCEEKRSAFRKSIIDAYHDQNKTIEGELRTPDGQSINAAGYVLDVNGNPTATHITLIPLHTVDCQASLLVQNCEQGCVLTIERDGQGKILRFGSEAEVAALTKSMYSLWHVAIPVNNQCSDGHTLLTNSWGQQTYARMVVGRLNDQLASFRFMGGDTISPDQVAYKFWLLYNQYTGDTTCRWYQHVTQGTTSEGCCPSIGMPGIFTLGPSITSHFEVDDNCQLIYVRNCLLDSNSFTARDTLCTGICRSECADAAICFKWYDPEVTDFVKMMPVTCEQDLVKTLRREIYRQVDDCIKGHRVEIEMAYKNTCMVPENFGDDMKVSYDLNLYHFTLFYYDRAGRVIRTVPPKGVSLLAAGATRSSHPNHTYVTSYEYNSFGQLVRRNTPDGGITSFWYDSKGRSRFTQTAEQNGRNTFSYVKYDLLGRSIESGESILQDPADLVQKADNMGYPSLLAHDIYRTIYTDASNVTYEPGTPRTLTQRYLRNRVSYTLSGDGSSSTYYSYDPHGNVQWIVQDIDGLGKNYVRYDYDLVSNNVLALYYNEGLGDQLSQRYSYDEDNRIKRVESSRDAAIWDRDAAYSYYLHGPLRRAEYGEDSLQGFDYTYTIQGWLKGLNHPTLVIANDPGRDDQPASAHPHYATDAFGMALTYYEKDFLRKTPGGLQSQFNSWGGTLNSATYMAGSGNLVADFNTVPPIAPPPPTQNLYNGNISTWSSNTIAAGTGQLYEHLTGEKYHYDRLNRLTASEFHDYAGTWQAANGDYNTDNTYDANGNILTLVRNGAGAGGGGFRAMDNLTYNYVPGVNRLFRVNDAVAAVAFPSTDYEPTVTPGPNFGYDPSGRLVRDGNEAITNVVWSPYDKVREVQKNNGGFKIHFTYDAQGNRIKKSILGNAGGVSNQTTYYVHDAGGKVLAVYTKQCIDPKDFSENPQQGDEGCVDPAGPQDADHDGIPDGKDDAPNRFNPEQRDTDGDGIPDALDGDNDNDGIFDVGDPFPFSNTPTPGDMDSDGIPDAVDPCPLVPGNGGADLDHDGIPDECDTDRDGDGVPDPEDNCPFTYNPDQADANADRIGDACECQGSNGVGECPIMLSEQYVYGNGLDARIATVKANRLRDMIDHSMDETFTRVMDEKEYELHDHLGNVRVRYGDIKLGTATQGVRPFAIDLKGYVNYYPFGMAEPKREANMVTGRYGYNGKEMDNEWNNKMGVAGNIGTGNSYDYGFRMYDPRLARFLSVDPLTEQYPWYTPYQFAGNKPIQFIDRDGLEEALPSSAIGNRYYDKKTGAYLGIDRLQTSQIRLINMNDYYSITNKFAIMPGQYVGGASFVSTNGIVTNDDVKKNQLLLESSEQLNGAKTSVDIVANILTSIYRDLGYDPSDLFYYYAGGGGHEGKVGATSGSASSCRTRIDDINGKLSIGVNHNYIAPHSDNKNAPNAMENYWDVYNDLVHERKGHGTEVLNGVDQTNDLERERRVCLVQMNDPSWQRTTLDWKQYMYKVYGYVFKSDEYNKYFFNYGVDRTNKNSRWPTSYDGVPMPGHDKDADP